MTIQTINIGTTPNDGTGDPARTAFTKINDNFTQINDDLTQINDNFTQINDDLTQINDDLTQINDNFTQVENAASRLVATEAQAIAGTADVLPDAAGVHAAIRGLAVGTVSQSGGVPTGAIIESGSNANGEYIKYADGTLICASRLTQTSPGAFTSGNLFLGALPTWTFPAVFSSLPKVHFTPDKIVNADSGVNPVSVGRLTSSELMVSAIGGLYIWYSAASASIQSRVSVLAVGHWY